MNTYKRTHSPKSFKLAFVLTFLFGPLGLLYLTVRGGIIMIVVDVVLTLMELFIIIPVVNFICVIWVFKKFIEYSKALVNEDSEE